MLKFIPAIVAVGLLGAGEAFGCNPVQLIAPQAVYVQPQVAPVVYTPVVQAIEVGHAAPVVLQQNVVVKQARVRRQPLRRAAQIVLPPYGNRQALRAGCY